MERPDLVVVTGDLVDGSVPHLGEAVSALGRLAPRFGKYFITGNHEYHSGDDAWADFMARQGFQVLRNRTVQVGDAGGTFDLVGVDDWSGGRRRGKKGYDLDLALQGHHPDRAAVLLAHQPKQVIEAAEHGVGLQLSGHTHGGQIFPWGLMVRLDQPYVAGLALHGDTHIYVSRGTGYWGPPMRVAAPSEITLVELVAA